MSRGKDPQDTPIVAEAHKHGEFVEHTHDNLRGEVLAVHLRQHAAARAHTDSEDPMGGLSLIDGRYHCRGCDGHDN